MERERGGHGEEEEEGVHEAVPVPEAAPAQNPTALDHKAAAARIEAARQGMVERKAMKERHAQASKISAAARGRRARAQARREKEAAMRIGAVGRGRLARKNVDVRQAQTVNDRNRADHVLEPTAAASVIEAAARGRRDRLLTQRKKETMGLSTRGQPGTKKPPQFFRFVCSSKSDSVTSTPSYARTFTSRIEGTHRKSGTKVIVIIDVPGSVHNLESIAPASHGAPMSHEDLAEVRADLRCRARSHAVLTRASPADCQHHCLCR